MKLLSLPAAVLLWFVYMYMVALKLIPAGGVLLMLLSASGLLLLFMLSVFWTGEALDTALLAFLFVGCMLIGSLLAKQIAPCPPLDFYLPRGINPNCPPHQPAIMLSMGSTVYVLLLVLILRLQRPD